MTIIGRYRITLKFSCELLQKDCVERSVTAGPGQAVEHHVRMHVDPQIVVVAQKREQQEAILPDAVVLEDAVETRAESALGKTIPGFEHD